MFTYSTDKELPDDPPCLRAVCSYNHITPVSGVENIENYIILGLGSAVFINIYIR